MTRIVRAALFAVVLHALLGTAVQAQTISAASCNASDVQAAFNKVTASITVVNIPAGTCSWTSHVYLNVPSGSTTLSVIGAGNLATTGGGDVTVITDNDTTDSNYLIQLNTGAASTYFRFAGITVSLGSGAIKDNGMLAVNGFSQSVRLDHLHLNAGPYAPIRIGAGGWLYGVIDHNIIEDSGAIEVWSDDWGNPGGATNQEFFGDGSWAATTNFGSGNAIFIENNVFNSGSISGQSSSYMSDCYSGGRVVYRYNTMNNVGVDTHPTGGAGADIRGCRSTEIYGNTFNGAVSPATMTYDAFYMQSGTALIWGNTATSYEHFIDLHTTRISNVTYGQSATPGGWGYCGNTSGLSGDQSAWDQTPTSLNGYKCLDEPGTGKSDLLAGTAPNKVDSVTGKLSWPNQALEPVYEWLNTFTPASGYTGATYVNGYAPGLGVNRDYYAYTSSFTGATGTGSGTLSARPSTCTAGVGYWATDTSTLYTCNSGGNAWTAYYTPYTYPHPLAQSGTTGTCTVSPNSIGTYTAGQSASQAFTEANCSSSTFTISSGSLTGSGLSLSSSTGVLSGIAVAGSFSFTVAYGTGSVPISLTINAAPSISTGTLPSVASSSSYSQTLATNGGTSPVTCALMSGSLSGSGLALNSNCTITGTAASVGTYSFVAAPTDSNGVSGSAQALSIGVTVATQDPPGVPTLVQHVATGMDQNPVGTLKITLPNPTGTGNALILGVQFNSSGSISSVADNGGNAWVAGPTVTNSSTGHKMTLYYALNVAGGTQTITVTFGGLGSVSGFPQAVVSEFYNVSQISAADGSSGSSSSRTAGTITTAAAGDLIYHWGADFSDTNSNGGNYNGSSITAGAGFTLLSADLQVGSADQYEVQSSAGSIDPTFTATGSATWGSLALALKSASAGTPPPAGIRIVHVQHTLLAEGKYQGRTTPAVMQFPSSGNLLVGMFNSPDYLITNVSDSAKNTWVSAGSTLGGGGNTLAQTVYVANASTSPTLSNIKVTMGGASGGGVMFDLYDITGAATSPFDKATTANGDQTTNGNLTAGSLTPSTANGLILNNVAIDFHTINGIVGSGYVLDSDVDSLDNDAAGTAGTLNSNLDEDNGFAHIYNATTNAVTFVYSATTTGTPAGVLTWGSITTSFMAASGGGGSTPTAPATVQVTVY